MLPIQAPDYKAIILVRGSSSSAAPISQALDDCYCINPTDNNPVWTQDDTMPNGGQAMTDDILLPDATVLMLNDAFKGFASGYKADEPVSQVVIHYSTVARSSRFENDNSADIFRMYHSTAILLPSGEVLVAGFNPDVFFNFLQKCSHQCKLSQTRQQRSHLLPKSTAIKGFNDPNKYRSPNSLSRSYVLPELTHC